jgi:hypothetical protein
VLAANQSDDHGGGQGRQRHHRQTRWVRWASATRRARHTRWASVTRRAQWLEQEGGDQRRGCGGLATCVALVGVAARGGRSGARWRAWQRAMARRRGRLVWSNLVKVVLEEILQVTTRLFSFLQVHLFLPSKHDLQVHFYRNGCS